MKLLRQSNTSVFYFQTILYNIVNMVRTVPVAVSYILDAYESLRLFSLCYSGLFLTVVLIY
mgnify:CR=1 FL=1